MMTVESEKNVLSEKIYRGFDPIEKDKSYLCLIFFCLELRQFNILFVLSMRIKYDNRKNKNCAMRTILIVGFYLVKNHNSYLDIIFSL